MITRFLIPLCLGCATATLSAQTARPVDEVEDLPPVEKPLGTLRLEKPPTEFLDHFDLERARQLFEIDGAGDAGLEDRFTPLQVQDPRWRIGVMMIQGGDSGGLKIMKVADNSPAARAGLQEGDVIKKLNRLILRDPAMLAGLIQLIRDQEIVLTVAREEEEMDVRVTPERTQPIPGVPSGPREVPIEPLPQAKPAPDPQLLLSPMNQLHRDNQETQKLLRELIDEVRKLRKE